MLLKRVYVGAIRLMMLTEYMITLEATERVCRDDQGPSSVNGTTPHLLPNMKKSFSTKPPHATRTLSIVHCTPIFYIPTSIECPPFVLLPLRSKHARHQGLCALWRTHMITFSRRVLFSVCAWMWLSCIRRPWWCNALPNAITKRRLCPLFYPRNMKPPTGATSGRLCGGQKLPADAVHRRPL
jgi:hypothetical protein